MDLGKRIRQMRLQRKLTQKDVADACDFTTSLLSKIENGSVMPPIGTLSKIAQCFQVKMSVLLEDDTEQIHVSVQRNIIGTGSFVDTRKGYSLAPLAEDYINKQMQPLFIHSTKGENDPVKLQHTGEEFIYIVKGSMTFVIDGEYYDLKEGDSIYFDAMELHGIERVEEEVYYLDILSD